MNETLTELVSVWRCPDCGRDWFVGGMRPLPPCCFVCDLWPQSLDSLQRKATT